MGYNPYMCIVCEEVEDNGWFGSYGLYSYYDDRCRDISERLGINFERMHDDVTYDVCHKCWRKGKPVKDPFFETKHTKQERKEYWAKQNKKTMK